MFLCVISKHFENYYKICICLRVKFGDLSAYTATADCVRVKAGKAGKDLPGRATGTRNFFTHVESLFATENVRKVYKT